MRIVKTILVGVISSVCILTVGYFTNDKIHKIIDRKIELIFPCERPISYSLVRLDTGFGISREEFLSVIKTSETVWENILGKELFEETNSNGSISINLIYDNRQESTKKLMNLSLDIDSSKMSYEEMKQKYVELENIFNKDKKILLDLIQDIETNKTDLQDEIIYWNKKGGADTETYNNLKLKERSITKRISEAERQEEALNILGDTLNTLAKDTNKIIEKLNLNVDKFNTTQNTIPDEFDEGEYIEENGQRSINIYQFDNRDKLARVVAHELGHALGIPHNDDPESIMYHLNHGNNLVTSQTDIESLMKACRIIRNS